MSAADEVKMAPEHRDYNVVGSEGLPPEEAQRNYWKIVKETLQEIYQSDPSLADKQESNIRQSSKGTQQKIYQTEPFIIASDLAGQGNRSPTAEEMHKYLQIKAKYLAMEDLPDLDELRMAFARE